MAKVTITNPTPFKANRRKCGWGAALTTCNACGRLMMGHNRGICSKCMRSLVDNSVYIPKSRLPAHLNYKARLRAAAIQTRTYNIIDAMEYENGGTK